MHITCPSCSATFEAEAQALDKAGHRVRCGRCGHTWREEPPAAMASAVAPHPAEPAPYRSSAEPPVREGRPAPRREEVAGHAPYPQRRRRGGGAWIGWILFIAVIAGLVAAAWHFRAEIVAEVPETAKIYRALNIPVATQAAGLEISGVTSVRRTVGGERRMVVSGSVINVSEDAQEIPMLRAVISDGAGQEILSWEFVPASRHLEPGAVATFETSTSDPPANGALRVEFAGPR